MEIHFKIGFDKDLANHDLSPFPFGSDGIEIWCDRMVFSMSDPRVFLDTRNRSAVCDVLDALLLRVAETVDRREKDKQGVGV